jgi:hypothetical protein
LTVSARAQSEWPSSVWHTAPVPSLFSVFVVSSTSHKFFNEKQV